MKNELRSLAVVFLRAGNLTFGGGDAITALLQRELVHRREWLLGISTDWRKVWLK